jgi:hypothetical protein
VEGGGRAAGEHERPVLTREQQVRVAVAVDVGRGQRRGHAGPVGVLLRWPKEVGPRGGGAGEHGGRRAGRSDERASMHGASIPPRGRARHRPQWRMSGAPGATTLVRMRIEIELAPGPPPSGVVAVEHGPARPFTGWLELLRLLGDAVEAQPPPGLAGGDGGEVAPGGDPELGQRV